MAIQTGIRVMSVQSAVRPLKPCQGLLLHRQMPRHLQDADSPMCLPSRLFASPTVRSNVSYSSAASTKASAARPPPAHPKAVHSLTPETAIRNDKASLSPITSTSTLSPTLNPPASTRPPPLTLPIREPNAALPSHLYRLGKAYLSFYRAGLKAILTNYRLLRALPKDRAELEKQPTATRASILLRERTRHDLARLPLFGLVVLLTGEFSPLVVLLVPKLTPLTCRIPGHVERLRRRAEERRARARIAGVEEGPAAADGRVARVLGLGAGAWDRLGLRVPFARRRVRAAVGRIVRDDFLIREGGGVARVDDEEVVLAAEARGLDVRGREVAELREWLARWIEKTTEGDESRGTVVVRQLLLEPKQHVA